MRGSNDAKRSFSTCVPKRSLGTRGSRETETRGRVPIFDQGYQHWKGPLAGHAWRWLAIARQGVRVQVRGWIVRILLVLAWLPAVGLVGAVVLWGLVEQRSQSVLGFVANILPADVLLDPRAYRGSIWT